MSGEVLIFIMFHTLAVFIGVKFIVDALYEISLVLNRIKYKLDDIKTR